MSRRRTPDFASARRVHVMFNSQTENPERTSSLSGDEKTHSFFRGGRDMLDRRTILQALAVAAAGVAPNGTFAAENDVYVIADLLAKPEASEEFRKMLLDFVAMTRKEDGCKHYTLLEDPAKAGHFYTFEIWADKAALDAHLNSPTMKAMGPKLKDILAAAPVITPLKMLTES
jgi:quinol monooxygenase YgiN